MATYDNPRTGVIHWVVRDGYVVRTACKYFWRDFPEWDSSNVDVVGEPADVTCCKCRDTASFLDAAEAARGGK